MDDNEAVRAALRLMEDQAPMVSNQVQGVGDGGDIMALAFLVLMEATESAQEDLKASIAEAKAINAAQCGVRQVIDKVSRDSSSEVEGELQIALDILNEMGEMESLRLHMAMDRLSKLMSTLSNILKKISDTDSSLVQNLK
jgi:hypothetical protein